MIFSISLSIAFPGPLNGFVFSRTFLKSNSNPGDQEQGPSVARLEEKGFSGTGIQGNRPSDQGDPEKVTREAGTAEVAKGVGYHIAECGHKNTVTALLKSKMQCSCISFLLLLQQVAINFVK